MKSQSLPILIAAVSAIALANCGGGGGSSTPPPPTMHPQGAKCAHTFSAAREPQGFAFARAGTFGLRPPTIDREEIATDRVAVRFEGSAFSTKVSETLARLGAKQMTPMNPQGALTFSIPAGTDVRQAANELRGLPGVLAAGPVIYRHTLFMPNDPLFNNDNQWDMFITGMPNAWGVTLGSSTVRIAVIDTGYDTANPDLLGKVDKSIVYDQGNGLPHSGASIEDTDGHGSDVSGIAAADTNNNIDVAGVGADVHLIEARVFKPGGSGASTEDIAAAINWAVSNHASVINLSLGSGSPDPTFEEPAVAAAIAAGVVVVAAAGNSGANTIDYPAADPGVISVGASAYCDSVQNGPGSGYEYVASYSNYGPGLTLVAPGGDPDTAQSKCTTQSCIDFLQWIENLDSLSGPFKEEVGLFAGTSQATPHVAGAVALMFTKDPALTPAQAKSFLTSSAHNIADSHQGSGRLDVFGALNATP